MPEMKNLDAVIRNARTLSFSASEVFEAFQQPERLALWWGPKGFTNTFEQFEFKPSGLWVFVMHAPNGASYPNESVFEEIIPNEKIVLRHVCAPHFVLTITLT
ncbi:polyketide cyclase, partial [bacterium]